MVSSDSALFLDGDEQSPSLDSLPLEYSTKAILNSVGG